MCGIAGVVYSDPQRLCDRRLIDRMRDTCTYRGPDDGDTYLDGPAGLGHRRLSIIDIGGGHQPMSDVGNRFWIVYNGEVYNYRELRDELASRGCQFASHSDTEVILQAYATFGEACVEKLNGMFAFAIWDTRRRVLFLARDRMGVKPLYYHGNGSAFVFASEVKALFESGEIAPRCRDEVLAEYLMFRQVSGPDTMFCGVKSLPPGCTMTVEAGRHSIRQYWSPIPTGPARPMDRREAAATLDQLLNDSVEKRLVSDVPVGTFCSGGVDSSLVTALAAKHKGDAMHTFSIGFDEADFDESAYARSVSEAFGTSHHTLTVGNVAFAELFPTMVWHNDEPLDFANSVHIFALSRLAKQFVTVVLTGEGSDELFAGYPRYRLPDLSRRYRRLPSPLRRLGQALVRDHRVAKLNRFAEMTDEDSMLFNASYIAADAVVRLCPDLAIPSLTHRRERLQATRGRDSLSRTSLLDQETFLVGILNRQDKMSMAASIESRVPFMDYRLVEFANRLPSACKLVDGDGKAIVKDVARKYLPADVVYRRKSGFGVPLAAWFRAPDGLGERLTALAEGPASGVFDRGELRRLVSEHRSGVDHSEILWTALNLATWREQFKC